jgi:hypothetical protein
MNPRPLREDIPMTESAPAPSLLVLLSDVHGNLPARESVLADIDARGDATGVYHLGDLVGYAPWPNEVVALLDERGIAGEPGAGHAGHPESTLPDDFAEYLETGGRG